MAEQGVCPSETEMEAEEAIGKLRATNAALLAALEPLTARGARLPDEWADDKLVGLLHFTAGEIRKARTAVKQAKGE